MTLRSSLEGVTSNEVALEWPCAAPIRPGQKPGPLFGPAWDGPSVIRNI